MYVHILIQILKDTKIKKKKKRKSGTRLIVYQYCIFFKHEEISTFCINGKKIITFFKMFVLKL